MEHIVRRSLHRAIRSCSCIESARHALRLGLQNSNRIERRYKSQNGQTSQNQGKPVDEYYQDLLDKPMKDVQPATHTAPSARLQDELPKTDREEILQKARVVFGSRLAGPAERKRELDAASVNVGGILVPPRPDEPDNCCMSGCVNCVWDRYRDELEEWAAKSAQARTKLQAQRAEVQKMRAEGRATGGMISEPGMPSHVANSMDDDGGGSETNWDTGALSLDGGEGEDLFKGVPIGIREFMRSEKRLKEKRMRAESGRG